VNFARSSFIEPETRLSVKRAWGLIESKRSCSLGEVGTDVTHSLKSRPILLCRLHLHVNKSKPLSPVQSSRFF